MIPLSLFRNRTFAVSAVATFFAVFGFSVLIIFLPLWFQIVRGESTTASGYLLFPFLMGLIFSSIAAGQIVSRTGRYKVLLALSLAVMAVGIALFHLLHGNTPLHIMWVWMLIAGLGVGPTMAIFTLIVQNDVPFAQLGTATSDLTLMRQIGTSVGLTMSFTLFRNYLTWGSIREAVINAGAPASAVPAVPPAAFDPNQFTAVGGSIAKAFEQLPPQLRAPFAAGFYEAFSVAIANSVMIGVVASAISFVAVLVLKEKPLRAHFHSEQAARAGLQNTAAGPAAGPAAGAAE
jgi:MFS family permease